MTATATAIEGLHLITMQQVTDERGTVRAFYRESSFLAAGLPSLGPFLQVNVTETPRGGLRGLHAASMDTLAAVAAAVAIAVSSHLHPCSATSGCHAQATRRTRGGTAGVFP